MAILVADPDKQSRRVTVAALRKSGYRVEMTGSVGRAISRLRDHAVDAVLVDPCGPAAVNVVQNLRVCMPMPIIVVSAIDGSDGERQRAALLDAGADDCLAEPFGVDELLARLRAVLRRATRHNDPAPVTTPDFRIDLSAMRCFRPDGSEVRLTAKEWGMVEVSQSWSGSRSPGGHCRRPPGSSIRRRRRRHGQSGGLLAAGCSTWLE